jgi:gamma-glutamyltranspeptidase/glutathione hydrolase
LTELTDLYATALATTTDQQTVAGLRGMVSTSHPLATAAGVGVLRAGGNAVDAAVSVAATLGVVEPSMSGPGGSGYLLVHWADTAEPLALDFMGRLPRDLPDTPWSEAELMTGLAGCLVPAAAAGWLEAHRRFGSLSRAAVFADAIELASIGVPLTPRNAGWATRSRDRIEPDPVLAAQYFRDGAAPAAGSVVTQPKLARTYRSLATDGGESFYRGEIAREIVEFVQLGGGYLSAADLAEYGPRWVAPIRADFRDWTVYTSPPPTAGWQLLETLLLFDAVAPISAGAPGDHEHLVLECIKAAIANRRRRLVQADGPAGLAAPEQDEIASQRATIRLDAAAPSEGDRFATPTSAVPTAGGTFTTAFVVADRFGNAVACTQTLGQLFGSSRTFGSTGVIANNCAWWADFAGPNRYRAGGAVESPLTPLLAISRRGDLVAVATPGSNGIMQTLPQMFINLVDRHLVPAAALAAPRVLSMGRRPFTDPWGAERPPTLIAAEDRLGRPVLDSLRERGHVVESLGAWSLSVGTGAMLTRRNDGVLEGAADPRRDGQAGTW